MRITEEALMQAIAYTENAKIGLEQNLQYMKNTTSSMLSEWNDAHVDRYMEQLDLFDSYVKNTAGNMDSICESLRAYLNMVRQYNQF